MADIIQSLWIGDSLGPLQRLSIASFRHFDHEYHLYCYRPVANIPASVTCRDGNEILSESEIFSYQTGPGQGSVAAFSNLFRYKLLMDRGGWWVDADVVCLRPFEFPEPVVLAGAYRLDERSLARRICARFTSLISGRQPGSYNVATAIIKLPPRHAVARLCYETAARLARPTVKWGQIGPDLLTRVVRQTQTADSVKCPAVFCPHPWWQWRSFLSPNPRACLSFITSKTYSVHLWHELWRRAGMNREFAVPPTSYYGELLRKYSTGSNPLASEGGGGLETL